VGIHPAAIARTHSEAEEGRDDDPAQVEKLLRTPSPAQSVQFEFWQTLGKTSELYLPK
jgi:hypothetical protein